MRSMLLLLAFVLGSVQSKEVAPNLDAYMFVDGVVTISEAGKVLDHRITTEVDPQVQSLIDGVIDRWLFQPVTMGGTPIPFTSKVRVTLHGLTTQTTGELMVRVADAQFIDAFRQGEELQENDLPIRFRKIIRPEFPRSLARRGVQAQTVLALRINRDGKVIDQSVLYTDLVGTSESEEALVEARTAIEKASLRVVRHWTFDVRPEAFPDGAEDITAAAPISFSGFRSTERWTTPGKWTILTRGQRHPVPWEQPDASLAQLSESGSGTGLGVKLLTQPDGNAL